MVISSLVLSILASVFVWNQIGLAGIVMKTNNPHVLYWQAWSMDYEREIWSCMPRAQVSLRRLFIRHSNFGIAPENVNISQM